MTNKQDGEEKPIQRKRRHHHPRYHSGEQKHLQREERSVSEPKSANHENVDSGMESSQAANGPFLRKLLAVDLTEVSATPKDSLQNDKIGYNQATSEPFSENAVTSGAAGQSNFIKDFVGWLVSPFTLLEKGFSKASNSIGKLLPSVTQGKSGISTIRNNLKSVDFSQIDVNGTILLLDTFIRKITGQKYISTADQPMSSLEAQGYALNIIEEFEKVVGQAALKSGISMHQLNINFVEMEKEIVGKIIGGKFGEISRILKSYVEKACPGRETGCPGKLSPKKFDKFMAEFNKGLDATLNQSMQQILHGRNSTLEVNDVKEQQISLKPKSYLNDTSVQVHLTQTRDLRNQSIILIS